MIKGVIKVGEREFPVVNSLEVVMMWEAIMREAGVLFSAFDNSMKHWLLLFYCSVFCGGEEIEVSDLSKMADIHDLNEFIEYWKTSNVIEQYKEDQEESNGKKKVL